MTSVDGSGASGARRARGLGGSARNARLRRGCAGGWRETRGCDGRWLGERRETRGCDRRRACSGRSVAERHWGGAASVAGPHSRRAPCRKRAFHAVIWAIRGVGRRADAHRPVRRAASRDGWACAADRGPPRGMRPGIGETRGGRRAGSGRSVAPRRWHGAVSVVGPHFRGAPCRKRAFHVPAPNESPRPERVPAPDGSLPRRGPAPEPHGHQGRTIPVS